eukprot:12405685-Karenia_brevis.AAC.1
MHQVAASQSQEDAVFGMEWRNAHNPCTHQRSTDHGPIHMSSSVNMVTFEDMCLMVGLGTE